MSNPAHYTDSVCWIASTEYIHSLRSYLQTCIPAKKGPFLSRKAKLEKKQWMLIHDFLNTHVSNKNGYEECRFNTVEELWNCEYLGNGKVVFKDDSWLVYLVDIGSGISIINVYVFSIEHESNLKLRGVASGSFVPDSNSPAAYCVSDNLFTITSGAKPLLTVDLQSCVLDGRQNIAPCSKYGLFKHGAPNLPLPVLGFGVFKHGTILP